jgi:hypothetical protein
VADQLPIFEEGVVAGVAVRRSHRDVQEVVNAIKIPGGFRRNPRLKTEFLIAPGGSAIEAVFLRNYLGN